MTDVGTVTFSAVTVPASADADDAADFRAAVDVRNRFGARVFGEEWEQLEPARVLPVWQEQTDSTLRAWLVRIDGRVAGRGMIDLPLEEGSRRAMLRVEVLPEWWGHDLEPEVLAFLEEAAQEDGRTVLQVSTIHAADAEPVHPARTGLGAVPDDRFSRTMLDAGYALEQVYRLSRLDVAAHLDDVTALLEEARAASTGYRYVSWVLPTPDGWIDDLAWLKSRMSTDAPWGGQEVDEEIWDAARVRRMEAMLAGSGRTMLVGAAQEIASGRLVALTELETFGTPGGHIHQNDTLVLKEHRGHRLGMLVKGETLLRARDVFPEVVDVFTGNAEENRPMLAINEAMGFEPHRYEADWQKIVG